MPTFENLTGNRYGRLTVVQYAGHKGKNQLVHWLCKCDCGNESIVSTSHLKNGHTQSCGCIHREQLSKRATKHGKHNSRLYRIWGDLKSRCYNENVPCYPYYGGRGICICAEWLDFGAFHHWAISNGYADNLTLDRIDVNGNYEPNNCRWVLFAEQMNNMRSNRMISLNGETKTAAQWARALNVPYGRILTRLNKLGWCESDALLKPIQKVKRKGIQVDK